MNLKQLIISLLALGGLLLTGIGVSTPFPPQLIRIWDRLPGNSVPIMDRSKTGSPLVFSGSLTLWEEPIDSGLRSAPAADFEARNISDKTILGFVIEWELFGSWGQQEYPGHQVEDCFFATDVIRPGETISFRIPPSSDSRSMSFDTSEPKQQPKAFVYVRYIQFTDGSEFGSRFSADDLFELRDGIWRHLRSLDRAYRQGGEDAFLEELYDPVQPSDVDHFFNFIRRTHKQRGLDVAIRQVRNGLTLARKHQDALSGEVD